MHLCFLIKQRASVEDHDLIEKLKMKEEAQFDFIYKNNSCINCANISNEISLFQERNSYFFIYSCK